MARRLRREMTFAVVDPDDKSAVGRGDEIEVPVVIDVGGDDLSKMNVIAERDHALERRDVDRWSDADLGAQWKGGGACRSGMERDQDANACEERRAPSAVRDHVCIIPQALLHQTTCGSEIEIEILRLETEALADVANRFLEPHQRDADGFNFLTRERSLLHAAH